MGIWATIAKLAGKSALAVGTGGASLAAPGVGAMSMIGDVTGAMAKAQAANRGTSAELQLDEQKQFEEQLLARELEKRRAQSAAYRGAMVGSHAVNYQPGIRPAGVPGSYQSTATTPEKRMAGGELYGQTMRRLLQPDLVNPAAPPDFLRLLNNPEFRKTMKPSVWEKILQVASVGASAYGAMQGGNGEAPQSSASSVSQNPWANVSF